MFDSHSWSSFRVFIAKNDFLNNMWNQPSLSLGDYTKNKSRCFFARVFVNIDLIFDLPNQILVERSRFTFIVDMTYEKLSLFCSNCKIIGHDLSNCRQLEQNANVSSGVEKIVGTKIQHQHPRVVGAQDGTKALFGLSGRACGGACGSQDGTKDFCSVKA